VIHLKDLDGDKACCRCGREYPRSTRHFLADHRNADGLTGHCKVCHAAASRARYRRLHPVAIRKRRQAA
jgi:hypothetical protein